MKLIAQDPAGAVYLPFMTPPDFRADSIDFQAVLAQSLDKAKPALNNAVVPLRHVCGSLDCPISTDPSGNKICWCNQIEIRDICD